MQTGNSEFTRFLFCFLASNKQVLNETNVEASEDSSGQISVVMHLHSPHGDQGFPGSEGVRGKSPLAPSLRNTCPTTFALPPLFHPQGSINVEVVYTLTDDNYFLMEMAASLADDSSEKRPTPFNLTNHTYFNLAGHAAGASTVEDHMLHMESERYVGRDVGATAGANIFPVSPFLSTVTFFLQQGFSLLTLLAASLASRLPWKVPRTTFAAVPPWETPLLGLRRCSLVGPTAMPISLPTRAKLQTMRALPCKMQQVS